MEIYSDRKYAYPMNIEREYINFLKRYNKYLSELTTNNIDKIYNNLVVKHSIYKNIRKNKDDDDEGGEDNENNNNIPVTVLNEVKNVIYDTSFIISNYSDFENMDGVIIPEVLEQLIYQEKVNKNSKVKKLFHMILDGNCRLRLLHDDVINDNEVQWYEDKADMAIILWAKKLPNAEVYTCDKALAIRCLQQNIKYR